MNFKDKWDKLTSNQKVNLITNYLIYGVGCFSLGFAASELDMAKQSKIETETIVDEEIFVEEESDIEIKQIIVKDGDTLTSIAERYNTTVEEIVEENNIENENIIYPGIVLNIRVNSKTDEIVPENVENIDEEEQIMIYPENSQETLSIEKDQSETDIENNPVDWAKELDEKGYVKGIDISYHQEAMDLDKVLKENDINFVMLRMAYFWNYDNVDEVFYEQAQICKQNNVPLGIYYWPTFKNVETSEKELNTILSALDEIREKEGIYLDMPICLDIELQKDGGGDLVNRIMNNDTETLEAIQYTISRLEEEGYYTMIYCSDNVSQLLGQKLQNFGLDVWVSKYYTNQSIDFSDDNAVVQARKYKGVSTMRQYTQKGRVVGYNGDIDIDLCYYNLPQIIEDNNLNYHNDNKKTLTKTN